MVFSFVFWLIFVCGFVLFSSFFCFFVVGFFFWGGKF